MFCTTYHAGDGEAPAVALGTTAKTSAATAPNRILFSIFLPMGSQLREREPRRPSRRRQRPAIGQRQPGHTSQTLLNRRCFLGFSGLTDPPERTQEAASY